MYAQRERKPAAAILWAILSDLQQGFLYIHHLTEIIVHITIFVTPFVEYLLEREIAQWVHHEGSYNRMTIWEQLTHARFLKHLFKKRTRSLVTELSLDFKKKHFRDSPEKDNILNEYFITFKHICIPV